MYGIDIVSALVVCGAASLAGAAMLALVRADSPRTLFALRLLMGAFGCFGIGMGLFLFAYELPLGAISNACATLSALGMGMAGWALRELNGYRTAPRTGWGVLAGIGILMAAAWAGLSALGFGLVFCLVGFAIATAICVTQHRFLLSARSGGEIVLAASMAGFAFLWLLRTGFTMRYQGPALIHHLYVPEPWATAFMLAHAAMPILAATLVMAIVNGRLIQQVERRALTDEVTHLVSRRGLRELGPVLLQRAADKLQDVAVLMLDIDHFKRVNESHGHLAGDDVLRHMAKLLKQVMRSDTMLVRYGGEEFALLVPLDHAAMAGHVAERVRLAVEKRPCDLGGEMVPITVSIGLTLHRTVEPLDKALLRADHLLYQAKNSGRNCICDDLAAPLDLDVPVDLPAESTTQSADTVATPVPVPPAPVMDLAPAAVAPSMPAPPASPASPVVAQAA